MNLFSRNASGANEQFDDATHALGDLTGAYSIDPSHSRIGFSARHAMVTTVKGSFRSFEGTARIDAATPEASSVNVRIETGSIDTGSADRDGHLVSADFLDAAAAPEMAFHSTAVSRGEDGDWQVAGDLTVRGTTKPIVLTFEELGSATDPYGNQRVGFEGRGSLSRKEWGLTWNAALETGGVLVSDKVKLEFDISAIKTAE